MEAALRYTPRQLFRVERARIERLRAEHHEHAWVVAHLIGGLAQTKRPVNVKRLLEQLTGAAPERKHDQEGMLRFLERVKKKREREARQEEQRAHWRARMKRNGE